MTQSEYTRRAGIEDRTQNRRRCREKKVLRFAIKPTFKNFVALAHDISANGVGFLFDQRLEPGTIVAIQIRGEEGFSMVRTARVMHVRRHLPIPDAPWVRKKPWLHSFLSFFAGDDQKGPEFIYLVGCRFNPPLSPEDLTMLCGSWLE